MNQLPQIPSHVLQIKQIPEIFAEDKKIARNFFAKFGKIKKFIFYPQKLECIVEFESHQSAQALIDSQSSLQFPMQITTVQPKQQLFNVPKIPKDTSNEFSVMSNKTLSSSNKKVSAMESLINENSADVTAARNELELLMRKPAHSAEERLQVLEARDKLFRAFFKDAMKATKIKGACKDMCPEKERYLRIARIQVSQFETVNDGSVMDHSSAIKQYSRSAADAEMPLPQDLRPESTLKMTMIFLLHNIMNLCEYEKVEVGEWYHFVWDRTRGIRKDITQQELCSPGCVELVEQCVRFHIHCAARLISEPPGVFDQKINTENLTKCLQTLKYMYDDLKVKNIACPNEAEFRAYVILLNLNDSGNFLWEIKKLNREILNSQEIRFALDVYFAISHNNYVKFFNLLRDASYLNACLLMRYFTQVRKKALLTIMSSYTARKGGFNFTLSYLTEILCFEDEESSVKFMNHHGLICNYEEDTVILDRASFGTEESPFAMDRCYSTVESKMDSDVAEIICGGSLPSPDCFLDNIPHTSFDSNGLFKRESMLAEDQNGAEIFGDAFVFESPKTSPSLASRMKPRPAETFGTVPVSNPFIKSAISTTPSPFNLPKSVANVKPANENIFATPNNIFGASKLNPNAPTFTPFTTTSAEKNEQNPFGNFQKSNNDTSNWNFTSSAATSNPFGQSKNVNDSSTNIFRQPTSNFFQPKLVDKSLIVEDNREEKVENAWTVVGAAKSREILEVKSKMKKADDNDELMREQTRLKAAEEKRKKEEEEEEELRRQQQRERAQKEAEEEREREKIEKKRQQQLFDEKCQNVFDEIVDDVVSERVRDTAEFAVHLFVKIPEDFYDALEHDVVVEEIFKIYRQEQLTFINKIQTDFNILHKTFRQWRQTTKNERIKREKLGSIGCCVMLNQSIEENAEELRHSQQKESMWKINQYVLGRPQNVEFRDFSNEKKIDLFEHLKLDNGRNLNIFWKLLISFPQKCEEGSLGFANFIQKWFRNILDFKKDEKIFMRKSQIGINRVNICMRTLEGRNGCNESSRKETFQGTNGIIFLASFGQLRKSRIRLQNILDELERPTAISMIIYNSRVYPMTDEDVVEIFDLSKEPNVTDFQINTYNECDKINGDLRQFVLISLQSLYDCHRENSLQVVNLRMQHIKDFLQITIGDEIWKRIEISCRENEIVRKQYQTFNDFIELHNLCCEKAISLIKKSNDNFPIIADEFKAELTQIDNLMPQTFEYFPYEWRKKSFREKQIEFVKSLKLKRISNEEFSSVEDFKRKFANFLSSNFSQSQKRVFHVILSRVHDNQVNLKLFDYENLLAYSTKSVFWLNVIKEIIVAKINENFANLEHFQIIYDKEELQNFITTPLWKIFNISLRVKSILNEPPAKKSKHATPTNEEIADILKHARSCIAKIDEKMLKYKS